MKTLLFFILFLFSFNLLNSQITFAPLGAKYFSKEECPPFGGPPPFLWEVSIDTILQGKYCTLMHSSMNPTCNDGGSFVHSDGYKVYIHDNESDGFSLLYDFEKMPGESYRIKLCEDKFNTDSATVEVKAVSNIFYNSIPAIIQTLEVASDNDSTGWWNSFEVEIYEGIGGINGNRLLTPQWIVLTTDCYTQDLCFFSPTTGAVSLHGDSQPCEPVSAKEEFSSDHFNIYPNPSSGDVFLNYDLPEKFKETDVRIFDGTGRLYELFVLNNHFGKINIEDLPTGFYYIIMTSQNRIIGADKLIIIN